MATHVHCYSNISCCRSLTKKIQHLPRALDYQDSYFDDMSSQRSTGCYRHPHCCDTDPAGLAGQLQSLHVTDTEKAAINLH